jgi:hypothetical protein
LKVEDELVLGYIRAQYQLIVFAHGLILMHT